MNSSALSALGLRTKDPAISWLMKTALERPSLISLAAGFTDNPSLPVSETADSLQEILSSEKLARAALQYGSTTGDLQLRTFSTERLQALDGSKDLPYPLEKMVITHGSQQFLYLLTECLCDEGDIVLVEDPTYFVYLGIVQSHGLQARGIAMEPDGISIQSLEIALEKLKKSGEISRVKMLYLVSYFQNPSGVTTSFSKKAQALELLRKYEKAAGHPIYLLEDAAYRELQFQGVSVQSALAHRKFADRVIYAGTYSKPFATGIRVGFGIVPEPLFSAVNRVKGNHDFGTSNILQQILIHALTSGLYNAHLLDLQARYKHKAGVMVDAIQKYFPKQVLWEVPEGGLYVWARLPKGTNCGPRSNFFKTALEHDVLYVPGELCYANDPTRRANRNEMRLSFGSASEKNIEVGIKRLADVMRASF